MSKFIKSFSSLVWISNRFSTRNELPSAITAKFRIRVGRVVWKVNCILNRSFCQEPSGFDDGDLNTCLNSIDLKEIPFQEIFNLNIPFGLKLIRKGLSNTSQRFDKPKGQ